MPFSDDEQILIKEKSPLKTAILILSIGLFFFSLFNVSFCTRERCWSSIEAFSMGWLATLMGGAALTWLANPFLIIAWILLFRNKHYSWVFALFALLICLSFLLFDVIIDNEAGIERSISKVSIGYWLWLSSCTVTFIGSFIIKLFKLNKYSIQG